MGNVFPSAPAVRTTVRLAVTFLLVVSAVAAVVSLTLDARQGAPNQPEIQIVASPASSAKAMPPNDDVGDFYLYQGKPVSLHRSQEALGVRFRRDVTRTGVAQVLTALVPQASLGHAGDPGTMGVSIVALPRKSNDKAASDANDSSAQARLDQARVTLNASPVVEYRSPCSSTL